LDCPGTSASHQNFAYPVRNAQEVAALEESIQALYVENQQLNKQQIALNTEVSHFQPYPDFFVFQGKL
jgi:cell division protein FtsB